MTYRNRKPLHVDLIVFAVCCLLGTWWVGFEYGKAHAPEAKVLHCVQKPSVMMYKSRGDVKYWRAYTRSLPK